ncbi:ABC transporter permease [Flexithrix dorotheae]|uniref:ABC transporter permease n=1 Tax=Flexithrix dorotheae TaxID=70993 RepID=UPI00037B9C16|nr:ABC transporter permease [Flexithrix dorotheae]
MIKNYIKVALRSLLKNKSYVIINTFGLGISLACCVAAYLLLAYNIEFDNHFNSEDTERIYKVHTHIKNNDGTYQQNINAPLPLAPIAIEEISGIDRFTRYVGEGCYMRYDEKVFSEGVSFADSTFFDMFKFNLLEGDFKSFDDKYSIFLSEKLAKKYFGEESAVGKLMVMSFANEYDIEVIVGGVFEKPPVNSTFYFEAMMRFENYTDLHKLEAGNWSDWRDPAVFFEVANVENVDNITNNLQKYVPIRNEAKQDQHVTAYKLEHFDANFNQENIGWTYVNLRISYVPLLVFSILALIILLIACFNLTNTSIALTAKRLKEVGVRKAIGARKSQIVFQFLFEISITITLALIVGLALSQIIVPAFSQMWELPYGLQDLSGANFFIAMLILLFTAAVIAGTYPAILNSSHNTIALLKGGIKIKGTNVLTRILVTMQFALSVIVLVAGVVFIQNGQFQESLSFGYDKENVITVRIRGEQEFEALYNEVQSNPKVRKVAACDHHVGIFPYENPIKIDTTEYSIRVYEVGDGYLEAMGLDLIEGREFKKDSKSDFEESVVVNQTFVEKTGLKNPIETVVTFQGKKVRIVGVVENHIDNLFRSKEPEPYMFKMTSKDRYSRLIVNVDKGDIGRMQKDLENTWKKVFPEKPFESRTQEEIVFQETRNVNGNLKKVFIFLTILGGLLSASGIFSLASLNIEKRTKEIGVRKVLGASVKSVVALINREFLIIMTSAVILGGIVGFLLTDALLSEIYAYHIPVSLISVSLSGFIIFAVGMLTTSTTIFRAARANPVDTLRDE